MATKYLDYAGLQRLVENIDKKYAPIAALLFKGSVEDIAHLPALNTQKAGWMYNVEVGGGTTSDFVEGAGHILGDGENVAVVEIITGYTAVPAGSVTVDKDPKALGWYELSGSDYVLSEDRIADTTKTYYTADTVKKWDILGGVFDLEGRYLEFGKEFPTNPVDERVFLYMGEDTFVYTPVASPSGRPDEQGWYELVDVYTAVTPVGDEDPSAEGWYESDGLVPPTYTLSVDTNVDPSKTYYEKTQEYQLTADQTVQVGKTYYTKDPEYKTGVIYQYDQATTSWVAKSGSGTGDMVPITTAEVDELFI